MSDDLPADPWRNLPTEQDLMRLIRGAGEPAEVQTARLLIADVVGAAGAGRVLDALDTRKPGNLARLARLLTAGQIRALAGP